MLRGAVKIALLAIAVYVIISLMFKLRVSMHFHKHHPGHCRQVKGADYGSEDLQVTKDGLAFITSGMDCIVTSPSFKDYIKTNKVRGRILLLDLNKQDAAAKELNIKPTKSFNPEVFRPHGMSMLEDDVKGEHVLYVINHPDDDTDRVEKFKFLPKTNELIHVKTFVSDKIRIPNDLVAIEEDKFYLGNCQYFRNRLSMYLELLPYVKLGSLLLFNGTDFTEAVTGLRLPNGMILSKDKRYLYLNLPFDEITEVYERKPDNSLTLIQTVPLYTLADNFHLSPSGDALYTGAHPITYKAMQHLDDPNIRAPSSVLRLPLKDGKIVAEDITELFYDHGDLITASSVAAVYKNKLLIGSVMDTVVLCDANTKF